MMIDVTEKELIKLGIKSISVIAEGTFKPVFSIKFLDEKKENISFTSVEEITKYIKETLPAEIRTTKIDKLL